MAAELRLKQNMQPVFIRKRNVPLGFFDKINQELDRLENVGILSKTEYNLWATSRNMEQHTDHINQVFLMITRLWFQSQWK